MKHSLAKIIGTALYVGLLFAVFFDPTEAALGSLLVTLPPFALAFAEILGNVTWLIGLVYAAATAYFIWILVEEDNRENYVGKVIKNGNEKGLKKKWHFWLTRPLFTITALIAIGSGFWFTGFFWLIGLWLGHAVTSDVRDNSKTYKNFLAKAAKS